jgi:predicted MFS family arabinose efflux permease
VLIALIGAPQVLWFDAVSYAFSCLLLSVFVPRGVGSAQPAATVRPGILAGLSALRADDFMRPVMISTVTFGFLLRILTLSLPLLAFERFGRDARVGGLLVAGFGAGALIGSFVSYLIANRLSPARLMGLSVVQLVLPLWVLATPAPVWLLVAALAVAAAGLPLNNAPFFSILATRFPDEVRTKVVQSVVTLSNIAGPLGYLAGGVAMQSLGVTPVLFAVAGLSSLAAANLLRAVRRLERPVESAGLMERQPSHV